MRSLILIPELDWLNKLPIPQDELRHSALIVRGNKRTADDIKSQGYAFGVVRVVDTYDNTSVIDSIAQEIYQQLPFLRIIAPDEIDILRAAYLRQRFKVNGQSVESALAFQDKVMMKQFVAQHGLRVPYFRSVKDLADIEEAIEHIGFPIILKPIRGTGCEGLTVITGADNLETYIMDLKDYMVEAYVSGPMYHTDGLVKDGKLAWCWPSIYLDLPLNILNGTYASSFTLSTENPLVEKLNHFTEQIIKALPTPSDTAFHLECFLPNTEEEPIFCEIASRVGGKGVNDAGLASFNIDLKRNFMMMQAGLPGSSITMPSKPNVLSGEVWFPKKKGRLKHIESACPFSWVKKYEVYSKIGAKLSPAKTLSDLLAGSPLLTSSTETEMKERISQFAQWFELTTIISDASIHKGSR